MSSPSRRAISPTTAGSRQSAASEASASGSASATGIRPVQIRDGRLWSAASSACDSRARARGDPPIHRQPLQRRGQHQPHQADGSSRAMADELRQQVGGRVDVRSDPSAEDRVERQVVGQQPDRPGAHRLVLVVEQAAEECARRPRR